MNTAIRTAIVAPMVYFTEYATAIGEGLAGFGHTVDVLEEMPADGSRWDVVLVVGIHLFPTLPFFPQTLLVGVQTEQLPMAATSEARLNRNQQRFQSVRRYYDLILEWNPGVFVSGKGGDVFSAYGCRKQDWGDPPKQHDLAFIGNVGGSPRRQRLLEKLKSEFRFFPDFSPGFGAAKTRAIRMSRILLNIHFYEDGGFESPRMFEYLSLGAFVLSEDAGPSFPFQPGIDFESFKDADELIQKIHGFLAAPDDRLRVARQGFETAHQFTFEHSARLICLEIDRLRSAPRGNVSRFARWLSARFRSGRFELRDTISQQRRRLLGRSS